MVAVNMAPRSVDLPAVEFWEGLFGKDLLVCEYMEDNSATLQIIDTGKKPKLKHVNRDQEVNFKWLHGILTQNRDTVFISLCPTKEQKADTSTNPLRGFQNDDMHVLSSALTFL